jgi:hypothetical protein
MDLDTVNRRRTWTMRHAKSQLRRARAPGRIAVEGEMRYVMRMANVKAMPVILVAALLSAVGPACSSAPDGGGIDASTRGDASGASDAATPADAHAPSDADTPHDSGPDSGAALDAADGASTPPQCQATAPDACIEPSPHFADVEPIFALRCQGCHSVGNPDGHWPLMTYPQIAAWSAEIGGQVLACTMPPPVAQVPITVEEREKILLWLSCGFPE